MNLDTTAKSLEVVLAGAITTNQLVVVADWSEAAPAAPTLVSGSLAVLTNNTTPVTAVPAPSTTGLERRITNLTVYNKDTVPATITINLNVSSTLYPRFKATLPAGFHLAYTSASGFQVFDTNGYLQTGAVSSFSVATAIQGINDQTGTSYTLALGDSGKDVRCTNASAITLTIPLNSGTAFPIGTFIFFSQGGAGIVTATATGGVTLRAANGATTLAIYDARVLEKTDTDTWRVW